MDQDSRARGANVEVMDLQTFRERYEDHWWTPNYWEAVLEMRKIEVFGEQIQVYGTTERRTGTRWSLCITPTPERRR